MSTTTDRVREAIQDHVRTHRPELVVTDFVVCAVSIDMHTADRAVTYSTITESPPHISYGLTQVLSEHLIEDLSEEEDDE